GIRSASSISAITDPDYQQLWDGLKTGPRALMTGYTMEDYWPRLRQIVVPSQAENTAFDYGFGELNGHPLPNVEPTITGGSVFLEIDYDRATGAVSKITNALGEETEFFASERRGAAKDPLGNESVQLFDDEGRLVKAIDALGNAVTAEYDDFNRLTKVTQPEGNSVSYEYDGGSSTGADILHNVTKVTQSPKPGSSEADIVTIAEYDDANWPTAPTKLKDALNAETDYTYDATTGQMLTREDAAPTAGAARPLWTYTYTTFGRTDTETNPEGEQTKYEYWPVVAASNGVHENGELQKVRVDPNGLDLTTSYTYNAIGDRLTVTGPRTDVTSVTTYTYDDMRRVTQTTSPDPDGAGPLTVPVSKTKYDVDGLVEYREQLKPGGNYRRTEFDYDLAGRQTHTKSENEGGPSSFNTTITYYDAAGRPEYVMDPEQRVSKTVYDAVGRAIEMHDGWKLNSGQFEAIEGVARMYRKVTFTTNGQLKTARDGNGNLTTYEYDGHDRLVKTLFPDRDRTPDSSTTGVSVASDIEEYDYDLLGNRTSLTTRKGETISFVYDALSRMTHKIVPASLQPDQTSTPGYTVKYFYDKAGRQTCAGFVTSGEATCGALSQEISYVYDDAGRMTAEDQEGANNDLAFTYDPAGNRKRMTHPDGFYVDYAYDALNRLTKVTDNAGLDLAAYEYDVLSRLTKTTYGNGAVTERTFSVDSDLKVVQQKQSASATPFVTTNHDYDKSGRLTWTAFSDQAYGWKPKENGDDAYVPNGLNQYASIDSFSALEYDANGSLTGDWRGAYAYDGENRLVSASMGQSAAYVYDPLGRRSQKTVDTTVTKFLSDGGHEVAELNGNDQILRRYVYGAGVDNLIAMREWDPNLNGGQGGAVYTYAHKNRLGSVVATTDDGAQVEASYVYSPFGLAEDDAGANAGFPFRYTGRRLDPETGFYYSRARYMDPQTGRFLQTDPIGYGDGMNMYAYVGNDPMGFTDPTGLLAEPEVDEIEIVGTRRSGPSISSSAPSIGFNFFIASVDYSAVPLLTANAALAAILAGNDMDAYNFGQAQDQAAKCRAEGYSKQCLNELLRLMEASGGYGVDCESYGFICVDYNVMSEAERRRVHTAVCYGAVPISSAGWAVVYHPAAAPFPALRAGAAIVAVPATLAATVSCGYIGHDAS
ncbi:MAG: RHS repeat-associated core domain-containing protein, partial [Pseudomonadota bacterium]